MNVLLIGDVVGRPGRQVLHRMLRRLIAERGIDFVIANAENAAGGSGLTPQMLGKLHAYGVDVVTMGDHVLRRRELIPVLDSSDRIVRPANLLPTVPGNGYTVVAAPNGVPVAVLSALGRTYMKAAEDPFGAVERCLTRIGEDARVIFLDMHAEATSDKLAMGYYLDGRVSGMVGTHTHVQTADERILPGGTAYITDLGMTGPHHSILGRRIDRVVEALSTGIPQLFEVAKEGLRINGVIVQVDPATGRATGIERINLPAEEAAGTESIEPDENEENDHPGKPQDSGEI
jgi:metallophosphoesterase (TIGR00282 family)